MKLMACIAVIALLLTSPLPAAGATDIDKELSEIRTTGAVLAAQIEDARLECSGEISISQLHTAVAKALDDNGFHDSDTPEWRAGMAAALRQHARYVSITKARQAEFCAGLIERGFIK
jgi:hypothetical protein